LAEIHIVRAHALGLEGARKLALRWAEVARQKLSMECGYQEDPTQDVVRFRRPGAHGELKVTGDRFELKARLGLLLGVFRHRIETEIVRNLDQLLAHEDPLHAFEHGLARHEQKHPPRHVVAKHAKPHVESHKPVAKVPKVPKASAGRKPK
jgi:putative polyhydroxyalkanoate system protein